MPVTCPPEDILVLASAVMLWIGMGLGLTWCLGTILAEWLGSAFERGRRKKDKP